MPKITFPVPFKTLAALVPFAGIGLLALALLRPAPEASAPTHGRTVVDAEGVKVSIAEPYRGTVLTWGAWGPWGYLENTRAPETLKDYGTAKDRERLARDYMAWFYPELLKRDDLWEVKPLARGRGNNAEVETLLAGDAGAYLGNGGNFGAVPLLRRVGLPALTLSWNSKDWDDVCYSAARVETALTGHPELGEGLIARYEQANADLAEELQPETLPDKPSVIITGTSRWDWRRNYVKGSRNSYQIYLPRAGVVNASEGWTGEGQDAERILAMDPDMVFLMGHGETPEEFTSDPRWLGLKAVHSKTVYTMPGADEGGGGLAGLIFQPLWNRWMAELAHPDRLQPKLREIIRARLMTEFGIRVSDALIDTALQMGKNKGAAGYTRFALHDVASSRTEP